MLEAVYKTGVDIRPEAMGITWNDVAHTLKNLPDFVRQAGLWYGISHDAQIDDIFVQGLKEKITDKFGAWKESIYEVGKWIQQGRSSPGTFE